MKKITNTLGPLKTNYMEFGSSQGLCATTETERFYVGKCACKTYEENLGPCKTFELGQNNNCAYCDHDKECHDLLLLLIE